MTIYDIRVIAQNMGIDPRKMKKSDLVRTIQIKEGYTPCFKTAVSDCDQKNCLWRSDCLKLRDQ